MRRRWMISLSLGLCLALGPAWAWAQTLLALTASPNPALAGEEVTFSALLQNPESASCLWRVGDEAVLEGAAADYTFLRPGSYLVVLEVLEGSSTLEEALVVEVRPANPVASPEITSLTYTPTRSLWANQMVTFSAEGRTRRRTTPEFIWLFGDGSSARGSEVNHAYQEAGTYAVTLYAVDPAGSQSVGTTQLRVRGGSSGGVYADAGPDQSVDRGARVVLVGCDSGAPSGQDLRYSWRQVSGPTVEMEEAAGPSPSFTAPDTAGELVFELGVSDGQTSDSDEVVVTVR